VRVVFENRLPESTTLHWHGLEIPSSRDGVPYISQKPVAPGEKYIYEFTVHQEGTFFYHAHSAMQEMMGQLDFSWRIRKKSTSRAWENDYGLILQDGPCCKQYRSEHGSDGIQLADVQRCVRADDDAVARSVGSRVRCACESRHDHHPVHLHGHQFVVTGTEGGRAPESTWYPMNTVLVGVAQARVVEFEAKYPGAWMIHCHLPHHMMNSMMDLLRDRQIQTADQTEAKAISQMESLARSVPFEHVHPRRRTRC